MARPLGGEIHTDSFGTYGYVRVTAELRLGHGVLPTAACLLNHARAGFKGLAKAADGQRGPTGTFVAADLVCRDFSGEGPNKLWVTDITEHPSREGKVFCCAVLDAFSRRVVGWSIHSTQTAALVTNALGMAIAGRDPDRTVIHSDRGTQIMSWAFTQRVKEAELMPSVGRTGTALDNAMGGFLGRMQVELLNRRRWRTRVELANAIFEYIGSFHNNRRRHSSLNMLTPLEFEEPSEKIQLAGFSFGVAGARGLISRTDFRGAGHSGRLGGNAAAILRNA